MPEDYAEYLLLNLLAGNYNDARFLWKRIPVSQVHLIGKDKGESSLVRNLDCWKICCLESV